MRKVLIRMGYINTVMSKMFAGCLLKGHSERIAFDPLSAKLLYEIYRDYDIDDHEFVVFSRADLVSLLGATEKTIRTRLRKLASYGFINVVNNTWKNPHTKPPMKIYPNPYFVEIFRGQTGPTLKAQVIKDYVEIGIARSKLKDDYQGFVSECFYGDEEEVY